MIIVYDCGSSSNKSILESCVDIIAHKRHQVDYLFLSHFDKDYVNSLRYSLNKIKVVAAVTPYIPSTVRVAFSTYTNIAYDTIMALLRDSDTAVEMVEGGETNGWHHRKYDIWEWIAKSMMTPKDFTLIDAELNKILSSERLQDPEYVELNKDAVNKALRRCSAHKGQIPRS